MRKEKFLRFLKSRGTLGVLTLCLVGMVAFATYQTSYEDRQELLKNAKSQEKETETEEKNLEVAGSGVTADLEVENAPDLDVVKDQAETAGDYTDANELDVNPDSLVNNPVEIETQTEDAVSANAGNVQAQIQPTVQFSEDSLLTWPAAGTVLMDYNMNSTVYFKTLNQYKYNPALIISSEVGNQVIASARGIVESVGVNEETGTTLKLNIGDNYSLTYGQLKEVAVSEGDVVEQGQLLGYVSEPTKYFVEEGSNLYFQVQKDGQPVDPFLYLE